MIELIIIVFLFKLAIGFRDLSLIWWLIGIIMLGILVGLATGLYNLSVDFVYVASKCVNSIIKEPLLLIPISLVIVLLYFIVKNETKEEVTSSKSDKINS